VTEPTVIPRGEGEIVGDSPERRVEILSDHDSLHATWSRFAAGREGADLHVHRRHTDMFYVLEGELTLRLGLEDEQATLPAGSLARVPPLVVHGFRNGSDAEVRYLNLHVPGQGFADYMRALRDGRELTYDQEPPPDDGVKPASEAVIGPADGQTVSELEMAAGDRSEATVPQLRSLYVLDGGLTLTAGGRELRAEAGTWLQLPPGMPHSLSADGPARFLDILAAEDG
jgi:quercetin dioxygenase-like cupin family protein